MPSAFSTRDSGPSIRSLLELCCRCAWLQSYSLLFLNGCSNFLGWSWLWLTTLHLPDGCWTPNARVRTSVVTVSASFTLFGTGGLRCCSCCCTLCCGHLQNPALLFFWAAQLFICSSWEYVLSGVLRCGYACVWRPETLCRMAAVPCHCQHVKRVRPHLHQLISNFSWIVLACELCSKSL